MNQDHKHQLQPASTDSPFGAIHLVPVLNLPPFPEPRPTKRYAYEYQIQRPASSDDPEDE